MNRIWKAKTNAGRVVYDRKKHEFSEKDLERIFRKLVFRQKNAGAGACEALSLLVHMMLDPLGFLDVLLIELWEIGCGVAIDAFLSLFEEADKRIKKSLFELKDPGSGGGGASRGI